MVQAKQEIAYLFELKGSVSCTSASKNVGQPWGFVERIYGGSMIDKLVFVAVDPRIRKLWAFVYVMSKQLYAINSFYKFRLCLQ